METKFDVVVEDSVVKVLPSPSGDGLTDALVDAAIAAHNNETAVEVFDLILTPMDIFGLLSNVVRAMIAEEDWLEAQTTGKRTWNLEIRTGTCSSCRPLNSGLGRAASRNMPGYE